MFLPFTARAKAWEPHAQKLRSMVVQNSRAPRFELLELAPKVGLTVHPCTFAGLDSSEIAHLQNGGHLTWSGGVLPEPLPDGTKLCILNPLQSSGRLRITLMEEICHCYFRHKPTALVLNAAGLHVRDFNKRQEEEAFGVGAAVLLPWSLLFHKLNAGAELEELSELFDVTVQLLEYRIKVTGATALYRSRRNH
jgi:IrrE N-terminal-like domain